MNDPRNTRKTRIKIQAGGRPKIKKVYCKECIHFKSVKSNIHKDEKHWLIECEKCKKVLVITAAGASHFSLYCPHFENDEAEETVSGRKKTVKKPVPVTTEKSPLKIWKEEQGLSIRELAEKLGKSKRSINRFLAGEPMNALEAVITEKITGVKKEDLVFTPWVMEVAG